MNTLTNKGWRFFSLAFIFALFSSLTFTANAAVDAPIAEADAAFATPGIPVLLTPLNGADNVPESVPLRWSPVDGADRYNVQVATDQAFSSIIWSTNVPKAPVTFNAPTPNTTYFWRVQASNEDGMSAFSSPYAFSTFDVAEDECVVTSPELLTPLNGATALADSVLLRWDPVNGAERYNVQVATNNEFNDPVFDANVPDSPVWFVASSPGTYYWHVQSVGPDELCDYGATWTFTVGGTAPDEDDELAAPDLWSPIYDAMNVPNTVNLIFEPVPAAERYNVHVATDRDFTEMVFALNVPAPPVTFNAPIEGATYFWRVQSVSGDEKSDWSNALWFTTVGPEASGADNTASASAEAPDDFALRDAFPNPFNPSTNITVDIPEATNLKVAVYDMLGREVMELASGSVEAGTHTYTVDASGLSSGMYLYRIETPEFTDTKRMVLMK